MSEYKHLTKAPITEAVIDFRVIAATSSNVEHLSKVVTALSSDYFVKSPITRAEFRIGSDLDSAQATSMAATKVGLRLHSKDEKYVAQLTREGFSLSRLEPYQSWEHITAEAQRIWPLYRDAIGAVGITRVAVRYINNLRLPMAHGEQFDEYLTAAPQIADGLPQATGSFLQRCVIRDNTIGALATITHAYEVQSNTDGAVPVILDIDVFREEEISANDLTVWQYLEKLRAFKNLIFFKNLTTKGLSTYV